MKFSGINHVAFATGDMDSTVQYWRDLLGMRLVAGHGDSSRRQYFFQISNTEFVSFFEWPGVTRVPFKRHGDPIKGPFVFDHLSIGMASDEDLWDMADRLISAGFSCSNMMDHGFIHSIYTYDPNGIPLEFSAFVPGTDIVKHPVLADSARGEAALQGTEPVNFWPLPDSPFLDDEKIILPGDGSDIFGLKK